MSSDDDFSNAYNRASPHPSQLSNSEDSSIATLRTSAQAAKTLLAWLRVIHYPLQKLCVAVLREVCSYLGDDHFLVAIVDNTVLHVFEVQFRTWRSCQLHAPVYNNFAARFVQVDPDRVMYCGGTSYPSLLRQKSAHNLRKACLISINGQVETLPDMHVARGWHGMAYLNKEVFVFLGMEYPPQYPNTLKSSEVLSLRSKQWEDLPDLQVPRRMFAPTLWRGEIYLCGGAKSGVIEVFTPATRSVRVLGTQLPESECILSYAHNDELVVVQERFFVVLSSKAAVRIKSEQEPHQCRELHSPVVVMGKVYVIELNDCIELEAESGKELIKYSEK